jgi:hypothetical protein
LIQIKQPSVILKATRAKRDYFKKFDRDRLRMVDKVEYEASRIVLRSVILTPTSVVSAERIDERVSVAMFTTV